MGCLVADLMCGNILPDVLFIYVFLHCSFFISNKTCIYCTYFMAHSECKINYLPRCLVMEELYQNMVFPRSFTKTMEASSQYICLIVFTLSVITDCGLKQQIRANMHGHTHYSCQPPGDAWSLPGITTDHQSTEISFFEGNSSFGSRTLLHHSAVERLPWDTASQISGNFPPGVGTYEK